LLHPFVVRATGVDIAPATEIGSGLGIHNFSGVFVDAEEIGECLTLNQGTTIGPDSSRRGKPRLGEGVFLGAGARVLGDITIGNHVVVAANALVTKSIPDNCLIAGVPGMIIQKNVPADYVGSTTPHAAKDTNDAR
jgi:serine O-acetyltransferase